MKASITLIAIVTAILTSNSARGADFDGSKPMICSVTEVVVCPRTGEVEKETAEGVNLPQFFFIDVEKKLVTAKGPSGDLRHSEIETVKREDGSLILQGVQLGKAWHAVINEETGKATITGATADTAFVVFAACTLGQGSQIREAAGAQEKRKSE